MFVNRSKGSKNSKQHNNFIDCEANKEMQQFTVTYFQANLHYVNSNMVMLNFYMLQ